jgi:hypothetical protein
VASFRPFAYNPSLTPISGTKQVGTLAIGESDAQQYFGNYGGVKWFAGPDEDPGYIITAPFPAQNAPTPDGLNDGSLQFWRSAVKTEESYVNLYNYFAAERGLTAGLVPSATGAGKTANAYLEAAGYWGSYVDSWSFTSSSTLSWPANTTGYTLYTGGVTNSDDGNTNVAIVSIDNFEMNNQGPSKNIYVSTNGYITLATGSGNIISTPQSQTNPAAIAANPSDNWLQPGLVNTDGDTQNVHYRTGGTPGKSFIKFIVYAGTYGAATSPTSWLLNLYVDSEHQWVETRVKSTIRGNAGPYNLTDVSQQASTTSKVWRGDLNGQNWVYMGTGSIF